MFSLSAGAVDRSGITESEERALIWDAQSDPAAFDVLYNRYFSRIYGYIRLQVASDEDADDLTQQVFLQALAALPNYRIRSTPFAAWLFRIARNVVVDFRRRRRSTVAWDALPEIAQPASDEDPEAAAVRRETALRVRALLADTDPAKREVLALRFTGELKIREIAHVLGRTETSIKTEIRRTLRALKERYDEE